MDGGKAVTESIDSVNLRTMTDAAVVAHYARPWGLSPAEEACFARVAQEARGKPVLDIGVGGGRTVAALREISTDYLGIDYSAEMVAACRARFPGVRFEHADARDMAQVAGGSIFLAVFSCNGIGMVSHEDRLRILREVHRVLQPGGLFVFSTHNRNSPEYRRGFRFPELQWSPNPLRMLVRSARFARDTLRRLRNRRRLRALEIHADDYAVINDVSHDYGTMLYYVSLAQQRRQLADAGFAPDAEAFDLDGGRIEDDTHHDSIALIARKLPVAGDAGA